MIVISFSQSKGGSGKSTLLISTAIILQEQGEKVAIVDTDIQGTASNFADKYNINYVKETDDPKIRPTKCVYGIQQTICVPQGTQ